MDGLILVRAQWDRVAAWALIGLGAVLIIAGGAQARQAFDLGDQLSSVLSGSIAGLVAGVAGAALLISAGLHDEWRLLARIQDADAGEPVASGARPEIRRTPAGWLRAEWDRALGWGLCGVSAVLLVATYPPLAASPWQAAQVAYVVSGGVGALLLMVVGTGLLVSADLRDTAHKLDVIGGSGPTGWSFRRLTVVTAVPVGLAAALVVAGWWQAAATLRVSPALNGLVLAAGGLLLAAVAIGLGGLAVRGMVSRRLATLPGWAGQADPEPASMAEIVAIDGLWTADGLSRFHRSACPALRSAATAPRRVGPSPTGLEPCRICRAGE